MITFRTIEDLIRGLGREPQLLNDMFNRRDSAYRYEVARQIVGYDDSKINTLIDYGIIQEHNGFLELEEVYRKFFEEVLEINEEISIQSIKDKIDSINENIEYYLNENNEKRKMEYHHKVGILLKSVSKLTRKNILELKRNIDNTYKNEPNFVNKRKKLEHFDEKEKYIKTLIDESNNIFERQIGFFKVAMDVVMTEIVDTVKSNFIKDRQYLFEIEHQIIKYLNQFDKYDKVRKKIQGLKYLKDQQTWIDKTNVQQVVATISPQCFESQQNYSTKISLDWLKNSDDALEIIKKAKVKTDFKKQKSDIADAIDIDFLENNAIIDNEQINVEDIFNSFRATSNNLFMFIINYDFGLERDLDFRIDLFCQIASQFSDYLIFSESVGGYEEFEYQMIYAK